MSCQYVVSQRLDTFPINTISITIFLNILLSILLTFLLVTTNLLPCTNLHIILPHRENIATKPLSLPGFHTTNLSIINRPLNTPIHLLAKPLTSNIIIIPRLFNGFTTHIPMCISLSILLTYYPTPHLGSMLFSFKRAILNMSLLPQSGHI